MAKENDYPIETINLKLNEHMELLIKIYEESRQYIFDNLGVKFNNNVHKV